MLSNHVICFEDALKSQILESPKWVENGASVERSGVVFCRDLPFGIQGLKGKLDLTYERDVKKQTIISKTNVANSMEIREFRPLGNDQVEVLT